MALRRDAFVKTVTVQQGVHGSKGPEYLDRYGDMSG